MVRITTITERSGARWAVDYTGPDGPRARAYWVLNTGGRSDVLPGVVGFYAPTVADACERLGIA